MHKPISSIEDKQGNELPVCSPLSDSRQSEERANNNGLHNGMSTAENEDIQDQQRKNRVSPATTLKELAGRHLKAKKIYKKQSGNDG